MGAIMHGGNNYSHNGLMSPATDVSFAAGLSGLKSKNVNDAILEVLEIVQNVVAQFTSHTYEYTGANGQTKMAFLKEALVESSRSVGGFHLMYLTVETDNRFVGMTTTAGTKCSFTLHSIDNPSVMYYGYFDNMVTGNVDSFRMYKVTNDGTELFSKPDFTI